VNQIACDTAHPFLSLSWTGEGGSAGVGSQNRVRHVARALLPISLATSLVNALSLCFCEEGGAREISHETLRVCTRTVKMVQARQLINDPDQKPFPAPLSHRPFCSPDSGSSFFSSPVLLCLLTARMVSLPFGCHISLWKPPFNEVSNFIYLCYYIKLIVTRFIFFF
jgi:hypothetical protein